MKMSSSNKSSVLFASLLFCFALCTTVVEGKVKSYYLKIEEHVWDYAPSDVNGLTGNPLASEKIAKIYTHMNMGKKYKKAMYVRYTDETFSEKMPHDPNLGSMGPTIRTEVGDTVVVHLFNTASHPYSAHPHGLFYTKGNEGALYADHSSSKDQEDDSVPPGGKYTYTWIAKPEYGPSEDDPNCLTWTYHSHTNSPKDIYSGLIGALIVCRPGTYNDDESRRDVDHEFVAMFYIDFEMESHYFQDNLEMFMENWEEVDIGEKYFVKGNKMHGINSYVYGNTPGYNVCQGDTISWHVIGMGTNRDLHTVHWQGQTITHDAHRMDTFIAIPASLRTVMMRADNPGRWVLGCKLYSHWEEGMTAWFNVNPECRNDAAPHWEDTLTGNVREFFVQAEEVDWDFAPSGINGMTGASLTAPGEDSEVYFETGPERIGGVYKKAVFREFTDGSFTERAPRQEDLGIMGPVIYGEVGDTLKITFKNTGSHPFNMEPHGVFFDKPEGNTAIEPEAVEEGEQTVYTWTIPEVVTPGSLDPNCITYLYTSSVNFEKDSVSGLSGPLLVCKRGTLESELQKRNRFVLMTVFDETKTWYFKENLQRLEAADDINVKDDDFHESNIMHALNGYMYGNLGGLDFCVDEETTVRLFAVGTKTDMHSVRIDGVDIIQNGASTGVVHLFPQTSSTITVRANAVGTGMMYCRVNDHIFAGTSAVYTAKYCNKAPKQAEDTDSVARTYYIAAEETIWDYNPTRLNIHDQSTRIEGNQGYEHEHAENGRLIGSKYKKALFYGYSDNTFTEKADHPEHLGFLGPVIKGEVGETIEVIFMNKANRPYNMFPWGAVNSDDFTFEDHSVQPGDVKRYLWKIPETAGPQANQPSCLSSIYVSAVDKIADVTDGLMGPLLICAEGGIDDPSVDRDFYLQFHEVDENLSHYLGDNIAMFLNQDPDMFEGDDDFEESNKMKAINGLFWRTPGLEMFEGETIRWHLIGWGSEKDYHSVHFHGHTYSFINDGTHSGDVFEVYPGFLGTVTMRVDEVGTWLLHCHVFQHLEGGMETTYTVKSTSETPVGRQDRCRFTYDELDDSHALSCPHMAIRSASDFIRYGTVIAKTEADGEQLVPVKTASITSLDLSANLISSKKQLRSILSNFPNLKRVDVSANRLRHIDVMMFEGNRQLGEIIARDSPRLAVVSKSFIAHMALPLLQSVDLTGNANLPDCFREPFPHITYTDDFANCIKPPK